MPSALATYEMAATADAPEDKSPEPNFLYRYFTGEGFLLYLGVTRSISNRDYAHLRTWWRPMADFLLVETFPTRRLAEAAEYHAFVAEQPYKNCPIRFHYGFESREFAWFGKRTGGKWIGENPQWFAYGAAGLETVGPQDWWHYGRPQIDMGSFVDPRRAMVMG